MNSRNVVQFCPIPLQVVRGFLYQGMILISFLFVVWLLPFSVVATCIGIKEKSFNPIG